MQGQFNFLQVWLTADQELLSIQFYLMLCTCQGFSQKLLLQLTKSSFFLRDIFPLLHPSCGHGHTCHVLSFQYCGFYVRVTNAITCDRFLWSAQLHHSLHWNRNNVKTLINDGQRNWLLQQSLLQCNQSQTSLHTIINCLSMECKNCSHPGSYP